MKYLCKKNYNKKDLVEIRYGEVVDVVFKQRKPYIETIYRFNEEIHISYKVPDEDLYEYFYLYDDFDSVRTDLALTLLQFKFKTMTSERQMLKELKYYVKIRENYLRQCNKEDIQTEQ